MKKFLKFILVLSVMLLFLNVYAEEIEDNTTNSQEGVTNQNEQNSQENKQNIDEEDSTREINLASQAKSAVMIEASTGKIIFEKNKDEKLPMASMTKMMTLLLVMENINSGNLKWEEMITTSEKASSMGGSQIFLEKGEQMSVEDLVKGICIASGNDAAVAMAERIGGTEDNFVKMMNDKAQELGLKNTHFANACGLDDDNHYSSAYDMALIAKELVKYDKILEFTGTYEDYLRKNTANSFWLVNTNKLVRYYKGVDGLKTGYTKKAMYCITTTAKINNMRLISVVMGEPTSAIRNSEITAMLDYGFNTYEIDTILTKDTVLAKEKVILGEKNYVELVPSQDITVLNSKIGVKRNVTYKTEFTSLKAPVKVGDKVGKVKVMEDDKEIMTVDITVKENISKANIVVAFYREILSMLGGNL